MSSTKGCRQTQMCHEAKSCNNLRIDISPPRHHIHIKMNLLAPPVEPVRACLSQTPSRPFRNGATAALWGSDVRPFKEAATIYEDPYLVAHKTGQHRSGKQADVIPAVAQRAPGAPREKIAKVSSITQA